MGHIEYCMIKVSSEPRGSLILLRIDVFEHYKYNKPFFISWSKAFFFFFFLLNLTFFLLGRKRVFFLFFVNLFFINSVWLCIWYITVGTNLYINEYI